MSGAMLQTADAVAHNPWQFCQFCPHKKTFTSATDFKAHLRLSHSSKEGGSFVCRYGRNNVCPSLPVEGVHEKDYLDHVDRMHVTLQGRLDTIVEKHGNFFSGLEETQTGANEKLLNLKLDRPVEAKPALFHFDIARSWTSHSCQNMSAVLNDPGRHGREVNFFTKTWGESFVPQEVIPLTLLPSTPMSYFGDYWKKMELRYMTHEKLKRANLAPHTRRKGSQHDPGDLGFVDAASSSAKRQLQGISSDETDILPEMFLHPNFSLEDPSTFNAVLPWSSIVPPTGSTGLRGRLGSSSNPSKFGSGRLLQEKLAHYLDITEVRLAQQIASKSEDFFSAMNSQEKWQGEVTACCQDVRQLRVQLVEIRNRLVQSPLNVMRLFRLRARYEAVYNKLKLMSTIHQTQPTIQLLLSTADFVSALDLIDTSLEVLHQELAGIHCFRHLGSQLVEMQSVIEKMMASEFLDFVGETLGKVNSEDNPNGVFEEDRLMSVVCGLLRQKKFNFLHLYKEEAVLRIKSVIKLAARDNVDSGVEFDDEQHTQTFGDYIRSLSHDSWINIMNTIFKVVLKILRNMRAIHNGLKNILCSAAGVPEDSEGQKDRKKSSTKSEKSDGSNPTPDEDFVLESSGVNSLLSPADCTKMISDSRDILWSACEVSQSRCSKIISMRAKNGALDQLSSSEFVTLARIVETFTVDCEHVCGRQSQNLRSTLLSQAKRFVDKFHEERKHKLSNILDIERWRQADVPCELQVLVSSMAGGFEKPEERTPEAAGGSSSPYLVVQGRNFAVVGTLLILVKLIVEYCRCVDDVPMLNAEILTKLCEILKMFNSRSCQLVLGAGALQTVGLKTITAKHLALVAQCLEVIIMHIHIIRNHFEARLPPRQYVLLQQFDQILKDYSNHRHELICKIVSLMEGIFRSQLEKYTVRPPMPSKEMRSIVTQVTKLWDSLSAVFPDEQLQSLFRDIRRSFRNCFAEKLAEAKITNDGGPQHGLVTSDVAFFTSSLSKYSAFSDLDRTFDGLWQAVGENRTRLKQEEVNNKIPRSVPQR